jgi:hypothetical protein
MAEHPRVPDLEELNEQKAYQFLAELFQSEPRGSVRSEPPRGLLDGDTPARRNRLGPREYEETSRGLPRRRAASSSNIQADSTFSKVIV